MTALRAEGCGIARRAMRMKSALRDLPFCVIGRNKHYDDEPPSVAFPPLWCLTAPPSRPAGKRVTRFSGRFAPLRIVFPCHRGIGRATKGKRLYGQARRLTSPDLHILCRMCTVDNKALKGSLFICDSTVSTGYSAPACGGKVVAPATKGGCISDARRAVV